MRSSQIGVIEELDICHSLLRIMDTIQLFWRLKWHQTHLFWYKRRKYNWRRKGSRSNKQQRQLSMCIFSSKSFPHNYLCSSSVLADNQDSKWLDENHVWTMTSNDPNLANVIIIFHFLVHQQVAHILNQIYLFKS
jgi:hypothetical protein